MKKGKEKRCQQREKATKIVPHAHCKRGRLPQTLVAMATDNCSKGTMHFSKGFFNQSGPQLQPCTAGIRNGTVCTDWQHVIDGDHRPIPIFAQPYLIHAVLRMTAVHVIKSNAHKQMFDQVRSLRHTCQGRNKITICTYIPVSFSQVFESTGSTTTHLPNRPALNLLPMDFQNERPPTVLWNRHPQRFPHSF